MAYSTDMGVRAIHEGIAAGEFSAREVAQATFEHIAKADATSMPYLELTEDAAFAAADKVDAAVADGTSRDGSSRRRARGVQRQHEHGRHAYHVLV